VAGTLCAVRSASAWRVCSCTLAHSDAGVDRDAFACFLRSASSSYSSFCLRTTELLRQMGLSMNEISSMGELPSIRPSTID